MKNSFHLKLLFFFSFAVLVTRASAQNEPPNQFLTPVVPPTPNAAALAKYVDVPVSYYTGTPQISVPIFDLKGGSITVPVAISYHASGNRVDDVASDIGLGWSLVTGGAIIRSVRGLPDESNNGFFKKAWMMKDPASDCDESNLLPCNYLRNVAFENLIDSEPDMYVLSLPGGGGTKFTFDSTGLVVMQNYQQIQITKNTAMTNWTVVTADGTQYRFGSDGTYGGRDGTTTLPDLGAQRMSGTTWHLSHIISADLIDTVYFKYGRSSILESLDQPQQSYYERDLYAMSGSSIFSVCQPKSPVTSVASITTIYQSAVTEIISCEGSIRFLAGTAVRLDRASDYALDSIVVKKKDGSLIKSIGVKHGYMGEADNYRLKLTHLIEYSSRGEALPPYEFYYDEDEVLPRKGSYQQDHWGYFNRNSADSFIPKRIVKPDGSFITFLQGGSRETDPTRVKTGMLTKVVYPEGGYDVFDYEANDIYKAGNQVMKEYYDEKYTWRVNTYQIPTDTTFSTTISVDVATSATIDVGGSCHGTCDELDSSSNDCERAPASATFAGTSATGTYVNIGWSCALAPNKTNIILMPGIYKVSLRADYGGSAVYANASLMVVLHKQRDVKVDTYTPVGGVRIQRISRYSKIGGLPKVTRFKYTTDVNGKLVSSGVLVRRPSYYGRYFASTIVGPNGSAILCPYDAGFSIPRYSLGEGTHIGYSEVKVLSGENGENGYEVFKYTTASHYPDAGGEKFPFEPAESRDNRRGLLLEHNVYDRDNNILKQTINTFKFENRDYVAEAKGLRVGMLFPRRQDRFLSDYTLKYYSFWQEWQHPDSVKERIYSSAHDGTYSETKTKNYFERPGNHILMTRQDKTQSDGSTIKTLFKYPQDYVTGVTELININAMATRHIYSPPIEIQSWKVIDGTPVLLSGRITDFESNTFKPSKIYALRTTTPLATLNNETTSGGLYNTLLSDNAKYELRAQMIYQSGKLVSQYKDKDVHKSYIWGYANTVPIAEVTNGDPSVVAFTSFEEKSDGNWKIGSTSRNATDFLTGERGYSLSGGSVTKSGLNAAKAYTVSFWAKSGSASVNGTTPVVKDTVRGWSLNVINVSSTIVTISGSAVIDDLRLYPCDAQMTSYTFDPLVGVTSVADANSQVSYYFYDTFKRLQLVKDFKGNILKRYTYNYATQNPLAK